MTNSCPLFTSPSEMPWESPFSQRVTLTRTQILGHRKAPALWLLHWPGLTLTSSSPPSTSSPETGESHRCFPPLKTLTVRNAGNLATSPTAVPVSYLFALCARSPRLKLSIAALTLPALRVPISNLSSPAVHPRWHAALTAKRSTLRAAGIVRPARKALQIHQKCDLNRHRTA